jgi:hypothetical protein
MSQAESPSTKSPPEPAVKKAWKACAIAIPPQERGMEVSKSAILGGLDHPMADVSPVGVSSAIMTMLDHLWDNGKVGYTTITPITPDFPSELTL